LFFIRCLLNDIRYKNQLKKVTINTADLDNIKSTNGLYSYQKDLVKFTIFIKHQDITDCRRYLARVLVNILLG